MSTPEQRASEALLALTNAVPGKEAEFQDWYWNTHIPEILEIPGFVAAHRYRVPVDVTQGVSHRFVTLYELEIPADEARTLLFTSQLSSSETLDVSTVQMLPIALAGTA